MEKKWGILLVLCTAVISGVSIFLNSYAVKGFDSSVFTFSKNLFVALLLFAVILGIGKFRELRNLKRMQWGQLALIGLIGGSIPFLMFFRGLQLTTGATSSFIHKSLFIYVILFALLFLKEKLDRTFIISASLLLVGNFLLLLPDFSFSYGHLLILGAAVLWGAETVLAKHVLKGVSGTVVAFGRMFFGSLFILVFLAATGKSQIIFGMSASQYAWIFVTSLLLALYVFTFYNGLKYIDASKAASILVLGSPITSLLAFAFQGASVTVHESLGIMFIVAGVISMIWLSSIVAKAASAFGWRDDGRN